MRFRSWRRSRRGHRIDRYCSFCAEQNHLDSVPVIVSLNGDDRSGVERDIEKTGGRIRFHLPLIDALACEMPPLYLSNLSQSRGISYISYDGTVRAVMDVASRSVGITTANDLGLTGRGVTVAVIDTGVDLHPDLVRPTNRIIGFHDFTGTGHKKSYDDNGHGTHVAGIVAGNGRRSGGRYRGMAPEATILSIKVLDSTGGGRFSQVIQGLQTAIETQREYGTRVVCLSLGGTAIMPPEEDPVCRAVQRAVASGLVVCIAAGNDGPSPGSVSTPGTSPEAITVGASNDHGTTDPRDQTIAPFSGRGPALGGGDKPNLVAPGVRITSCQARSLAPDEDDSPGDPYYVTMSGTSMATPVVAGAVALLLEKEPRLTPSQVRQKLLRSAMSMKASPYEQGAGLLNLRALFKS
ncbi:MAG: S8 family peptidase [Bacillota bacterium]